jgi:hypothetical protein
MPDAPIKIFVASSVYGFEDSLDQICATLGGFGYEVWNSHTHTIPINNRYSTEVNCIRAVEQCDCLFGIIREKYGTGVIGERSITHSEIRTAINRNIPCWFAAKYEIKIAREVLKQYMYRSPQRRNRSFSYRSTAIMDDIRIIDLYNEAIRDYVPLMQRTGNWVDEYRSLGDILKILDTQFGNVERIRRIVNGR